MEIVPSSSLDSVRVYFTDLDLRLVVEGGASGARELTRRLKLLSMLKEHVVVAASHLVESMSVFPLIRENTALLSHGVIVPALRQEFATLADFVSCTDPKRRTSWVGVTPVEEAAKLVDSFARYAVRWNVDEASALFTRLVVDHLLDEQSLLRSMLPDVSQALAERIVQELKLSERLSRDDITNSLSLFPSDTARDRFRRYADLAYYIGGAKAVESVGVLPQENLGKFDYGTGGRLSRLSEWDIFFDHCANAIFAVSGPRIMPEDLDGLDVEAILALRDRWIGPRFREKYERILTLCRERVVVKDPHNLVLRLEELDVLAHELALEYRKAAERERLIKKVTNTGMSVLSLVLSGVLDMADYAVTGLQVVGDWIDTDQKGRGTLARVQRHIQAVRKLAGDIIAPNQELTRFVDSLTEKVRIRIT